jgi:CO/xanthine dehydrogenase Mo-binding subunit
MSRPFRYVGRSVPRLEDPELLSGRARYLDDVQLPGALEVAFVRSPYAHARLVGIRADAARTHDGVALVVTSDELGEAPEIVTGSSRPEAGTRRRPQPSSPRPGTPPRMRVN